ncbi:hypothetical protein [Bradyrhizobium sp. Gha]|nr:hypothetical protein [Bradyrhizobium sp. Gha]
MTDIAAKHEGVVRRFIAHQLHLAVSVVNEPSLLDYLPSITETADLIVET